MRVERVLIALLLTLSAAFSRDAYGQTAPSQPWALFSARYDTRTSDFIYAVYGYGDTFGMVAVLHNPRSNYSEVLGGLGRNFHLEGQAQSVAVAVSRASDAWYGQLYYLPAVHWQRLWVRATTELYLPLQAAGAVQFAFSPIAATLPLPRGVEAGVAADFAASKGSTSSVAAGPEIRVAIPKAVLGVDVQKVVDAPGARCRVFFLSSF